MDKRLIPTTAIIAVFAVFLVNGCVGGSAQYKTFSDGNISFEYSDNWPEPVYRKGALPTESAVIEVYMWDLTAYIGDGISIYYMAIPEGYMSTEEYFEEYLEPSSTWEMTVIAESIEGNEGYLELREDIFEPEEGTIHHVFKMIECEDDRFLLRTLAMEEDHQTYLTSINHAVDSFKCI